MHILAVIILSLIFLLIFFFIPPEIPYMPFIFIFLVGTLIFLLSLFAFKEKRHGLLLTAGAVAFLILGYFELANWLNLILIIAFIIIIEYYIAHR